jgi:hypothetical protein
MSDKDNNMKGRHEPMGCRKLSLVALMALLLVSAGGPGWAQSYTITTNPSDGGKIKPVSARVKAGKRKTFSIKPDKGWHVAVVTLNGATVYDKDDSLTDAPGIKVKGKRVKYTVSNVTADSTLNASFEQDRTYNLTLSVEGNGAVKVRPGSMTCRSDSESCEVSYAEDMRTKLKAKPAKGYLFAGWSGSTSGIKRQGKVVMNGDKTITARFEPKSAPASALEVAEKISVVEAKEDAPQPLRIGSIGAAVPPDSDYEQDKTFTFVEERSVEAFETINEILCMAAQTQYEEMLNRGPYKALVDEAQCDTEKDDASSADGQDAQSSGSSRPEYMEWIVNSRRKDNASPHIVKVWVREEGEQHEHEYEPPMMIFARIEITESASDANPYGIFTAGRRG